MKYEGIYDKLLYKVSMGYWAFSDRHREVFENWLLEYNKHHRDVDSITDTELANKILEERKNDELIFKQLYGQGAASARA